MLRRFPRVRGLGFLMWQARHEFYHILIGLMWAWFLRERWNEFNAGWIAWAVFGSLIPDIDHAFYVFSYGKTDQYARDIRKFLRNRQWRMLTVFVESGHKHQTNLASHNIYVTALLIVLALCSSLIEWRVGLILFGAMTTHYIFDIVDDFVQLGTINPNWKRWGRQKQSTLKYSANK